MKKNKSENNLWPTVQYVVRISVAKKDDSCKNKIDPRYEGWREVWAKCSVELFDRSLTKKFMIAYLKEILEYANSFPMVCKLTKGMTVIVADSENNSSMYRYYGKKEKVLYRIGVEILSPMFAVAVDELMTIGINKGA